MRTNNELLEILEKTVPPSGEKLILGELINRGQGGGGSINGLDLFKHPGNIAAVPEKNDILKGFFIPTKFYELLYNGVGQINDINSYRIITELEIDLFP